ncbi:MAG: hypothetical protein VX601_10255, partial [Pseudomonadota bacterium]|nr:hypothetical protein [Pseudomonadota bacterium]
MGKTGMTKREELLNRAEEEARKLGHAYIPPKVIFSRASNDDIDRYDDAMLARSSVRAAADIAG